MDERLEADDALACFSRASLPQFWRALRDQSREMRLHEQEAWAADARGDRKFAAELREIARVYRETTNAAFLDFRRAVERSRLHLTPAQIARLPSDGCDLTTIDPEHAAAACEEALATLMAASPAAPAEQPAPVAPAVAQPVEGDAGAKQRLLAFLSKGEGVEAVDGLVEVLNSDATVEAKLRVLHKAMPGRVLRASLRELSWLLGCSPSALRKTSVWREVLSRRERD